MGDQSLCNGWGLIKILKRVTNLVNLGLVEDQHICTFGPLSMCFLLDSMSSLELHHYLNCVGIRIK